MAAKQMSSVSAKQREPSTPSKNGSGEGHMKCYSTRITDAILEGDAETLEKIIKERGLVKLDDRFAPKYHPLSLAVEKGHTDCITLLLKLGHAPDGDSSYQPALLSAIQTADVNLKVVEALLDGGCNVNGADDLGRSALYHAIAADNLPLISLLVDHGAHLHKPYDFCEFTPGMLISSLKCLQLLLDKGVAQSYNDFRGRNILMCLIISTAKKPALAKACILLLKEAGISVNAKDGKGKNALMYASECNNIAALQMLKESEANMETENEEGATTCPLFSAICSESAKATQILLNTCSGDILKKWQNERKTKVVQLVMFEDNLQTLNVLLKKGWPLIRSEELGGDSMMHDAAGLEWESCRKCFKVILNNWLNEDLPLNEHENFTCTPAFAACKVSKIYTLNTLLMNGADPTIPHADGTEPITALLQRSIFRCSGADWYPYWMWPISDKITHPLLREKPTPSLAETIKCLQNLMEYGYDRLQMREIVASMLKNAAVHSVKWSPDPALRVEDEELCEGAWEMFMIVLKALHLSYPGDKYANFYVPLQEGITHMAADHPFQKYMSRSDKAKSDISDFSRPCPLKQLSRDAVRRFLPKPVSSNIGQLQVPSLVQEYLELSDVMVLFKGLRKYYKLERAMHHPRR